MLWDLMNSWKAFCILLAGCGSVFLQKVVEIVEEVVVSWQEVRWIWWMRQNFVAQFVQLLKHWLYNVWSGINTEKNWALPVDQCCLQTLQVSMHLINLLSILLRCNGFTGIQKALVDLTGSRWQTVTMTYFWYKLSFGKCFGASSGSNHWADLHW